ncbi:hypothetical protein O6H91_01G120700 [Diphasiastrum complanatum]|nr:hypothetical protein O6H91_01G120700 [Diphasiastrum complanatum]
MAARAYDVAALALKGPNTKFNFPDSVHTLPKPATDSPKAIQEAAAAAASTFARSCSANGLLGVAAQQTDYSESPISPSSSFKQSRSSQRKRGRYADIDVSDLSQNITSADQLDSSASLQPTSLLSTSEAQGGYIDEDLVFHMPNVLASMAEAMMLAPPHLERPLIICSDEENTYWEPALWEQ